MGRADDYGWLWYPGNTWGPGPRSTPAVDGDRLYALDGEGDLVCLQTADGKLLWRKNLVKDLGGEMMTHWGYSESLLVDGRGQSEVRQGVTTQIMGEGWSWGPVNPAIKQRMRAEQTDIRYDIEWTTLAEYLKYLEKRGVSQNFASFIGAATIREYVIGLEDKPPTPGQLDQMRELVRNEMEQGALGITTALIYPPAFFAKTDELIELCKVAARYKGKYTVHMRSEGNQLIEGVQETIRISREAGLPAEIYHLKADGVSNWPKMDQVIRMIEAARRQGLKITANMYTYPAGGTGLDAAKM